MKLLKLVFVLLLGIGFMSSCMDTEYPVWDGPTVVEFAPRVGSSNSYVMNAVNVNTSGPITVRTQLVGPHESSDTTVNLSVGGTAVAGTHYNISHSSSVTIPANSSYGDITVTPIAGGFTSGQSRSVVLEITGGTFPASPNYHTFTINFTRP